MAEFAGTDRFEVLRQLGRGGMGVVYEVLDREREQRVALKTLHDANADRIYRLKREFRALADLSHPNLVHLHELFVDGADCFFTMELVRGQNFLEYCLGHSIESRETPAYDMRLDDAPSDRVAAAEAIAPISVPQGRRIASDERRLRETLPQLAQGIHALHVAGKVHRDIKPSNVVVTDDKRVVILDFGLVADIIPDDRKSFAGLPVGTAEYMAPEQGDGEATEASDWYGVGVMLYEALTGRLPFRGPIMEVLFAKLRRAPPPPRAIVPDVPEDLDELCVELLAREPKRRPRGVQVMRALGVDEHALASFPRSTSNEPLRGPFAGRDQEMQQLLDAAARVEAGAAAVVLVQGPSGIGKSEMIQEFLQRTAKRSPDCVLLSGRCYEREAVPYSAMDSLIDDLSRLWIAMPEEDATALLPRWASVLPRVFPVLGRVPVVANARERLEISNPQELRTRAFAALREVLQRLGEQYPVVLYLDDMQWVDADTVALLADLMRPPDPPALLLLLCSSDFAPLERMLQRLGTVADRIVLGPLDPHQSLKLAKQLLGPKNRALAQWIATEAGGIPFLIDELARYSQTVDSIGDAAPRIDDLIGARIQTLPETSRRLLEVLAVAAEPLDSRVAASAARLDEPTLAKEIRFLRVGHLIRTASREHGRVELYHGRIREAVVAALSDEVRARYHEALAIALEQWGTTSAERLARHWRGAGYSLRAAEHSLRAAEEAARKLDFDRAAGHYELTLRDGEFTGEERRRLLTALGDCLSNAGRPRAAARAFLQATEGAEAATRLDLRRRSAEELLCGGYQEEGLAAIRDVLSEIGMSLAPRPRGTLARLAWHRARLRLRGLGYRRRLESELPPAKLTRSDVCRSVSTGLGFVDTVRAAEFQARTLRLALDLGEERRIARALAMEASFLGIQGKGTRSRQLTERARALGGDDLYLQALALRADASVHYFVDNDWSAARENLLAATDIWRTHYSSTGHDVDTCVIFASFCDLFLGNLRELARSTSAYVHEAERRGDRFASVCTRSRLNLLWLVRDDPDGARADLDDAMQSWMPWDQSYQVPHYYGAFSGAELALYTGDPDAAARLIDEQARPLARSLLLHVPIVSAEYLHLRGRVAVARADLRQARTICRKLRRIAQPVAAGYGHLIDAGIESVAGNADAAARHLRDAISVLEGLDTRLFAAAAEYQLGALLGGDEGKALVDAADAWMREGGVARPSRLAALLVPGFDAD